MAPHCEVLSLMIMLFLVPTFFLVFSIQCDVKIQREVAVHPVPADVELFATFTIPQVEEADLHLCRICTELVCGIVL